MRPIIKFLIDKTEYIFDVFPLIELVVNGHRNELIEEGVSMSGHLLRAVVLVPNCFRWTPELSQAISIYLKDIYQLL